jgi:hypothetical protein
LSNVTVTILLLFSNAQNISSVVSAMAGAVLLKTAAAMAKLKCFKGLALP